MLVRGIAQRYFSVLTASSISASVGPLCDYYVHAVQQKGRAVTANLHFSAGNFRKIRSWTIPLPGSTSKHLFAIRAMAQNAPEVPLAVVYVTVPNKEIGSKLANGLVTNKLAACVNQVPGVVSTYVWQGKIETDDELLLIIKTRQSLVDDLAKFVTANHPYEVPEVIALPITTGSGPYVKWVAENTVEKYTG